MSFHADGGLKLWFLSSFFPLSSLLLRCKVQQGRAGVAFVFLIT
jgi:hypothetical protein